MLIKYSLLIQILLGYTYQVDINDTELKLVQILIRHGDRTPVYIWPNNLNKASVWDVYGGLGVLTPRGMKQHYDFGMYLREFYSQFLSKHYNRSETYAYSTNYDRTIVSTYSLLSGLFEPDQGLVD